MIGAEKSQISANAAIDYTKPYQTVHAQMSASRFPSEFSTSGDYRFRSEIRTIQADSVPGTFRLNASATDNWGQPLEIWFTVLNESTGQYLYDSGWTLSPIVSEAVQVTASTTTLRTYFRVRYPEGKGTNPIGNSYFSGAEWSITYDRLVQTESTIPDSWLVTTTADMPTLIDTSTTVVSVPQEYSTTVAPETVEGYMTIPDKVRNALVYALGIIGRLLQLKYVTPAICFGLIVALAGWLLH